MSELQEHYEVVCGGVKFCEMCSLATARIMAERYKKPRVEIFKIVREFKLAKVTRELVEVVRQPEAKETK